MSSGKSPAAPILGAHMSISGGYFRAVEIARECGCECVQLFTKNNNQWRAKPITADDERLFRDALSRLNIGGARLSIFTLAIVAAERRSSLSITKGCALEIPGRDGV